MKHVSLAEVCESIDYGVTASASSTPGGPKFLRITDIQDGNVNWDTVPYCIADERKLASSKLRTGDIVFARTGATTGKSFLISSCPANAVFASYLIRVRPSQAVMPAYLAHFFNSSNYWSQVSLKAVGAAQPGINASKLKELEIPLPPLEEQKRIAAILDQADALRRLRRRALDHLNTLEQAIFNDVQLLVAERAEIHCIGGLCDLVRGSSPRPQGDPRFFGGPVPRLMIADITRDGMEVTPKIDSLTIEGAKKSRPMAAGEVVMAVSGAVGLPAVLQTDACIHDGFVGFRRLDERVRPKYLYHILLSQMANNKAKGTGAIWSNLTTEYVKNIQISVPPLEEQDRILSKISAISTQKKTAARDFDVLDRLFTSLQHRAFRGEL